MVRHLNTAVLIVMMSGSANQALAWVDAQLLAGQRMTKLETSGDSESINATEVQAAVHIDPIPLMPLAFGLYAIMHDYKTEKDGDVAPFKSLTGTQFGAEALVWLPFKPTDFSLFAKAGYTFMGSYVGKNDEISLDGGDVNKVEAKIKATGTKLGVGLKWTPIALVGALLQVDYAIEKMEFDEIKINNTKADVSGIDKVDASSVSVLVGFEVRF